MKILILGATGTINHHVAEEIATGAPQIQLRLTSRRKEGVRQFKREFPNAKVFMADHYDQASLEAAIEGVDKIMVVNPDMLDEARVCSNLIEAIDIVGGVQHVLRLLSYPPGLTPADVKPEAREIPIGFNQGLTARQVLDASDLPLTYVNVISTFMTNLLWSADMIRNKQKFVMPSPQTQTWIHPVDIAKVCAKILSGDPGQYTGKTYELSGVELISYDDIAEMLTQELGISIEHSDDEALLREMLGEDFTLFAKFFEFEKDYYANIQATNIVEQFLGRQPYSMQEWIRENTGKLR